MTKAARDPSDRVEDLLRMPQRLVVRTSMYLRQLADLAAQGSVEPRDYLEKSFQLWSGALDDLGDWLDPDATSEAKGTSPLPERVPVIANVPVIPFPLRRERADIGLSVPAEVFDRFGEDAVVLLSIEALTRTSTSPSDLRPAMTLSRDQNLRISPDRITRAERNNAELKVFGLPAAIATGDTFAGIVWGATEADPKSKFPVAVAVVTVA